MPFDWPAAWPIVVAGAAIVLCAGVVRGYAGFGFSAISVAGLALLVPPARIVPAVFALEVLASVTLLRAALRDVDGRWLFALVVGNALCIPLGVLVLARVPETPLRLVIGALLLTLTVVQRAGLELRLAATPLVRFGVGAASGLANGIAAIGGIVVAVLLGPAQLAPAALRATLIVLFLLTDVYALAWAAFVPADALSGSLLDRATLAWTACLAPAMLVGIAIGRRAFAGTSVAAFRRRVLDLLLVVSTLAIVRAGIDLAR
jgi:uncharacterized membrane protein YfcA